MHMRKQRLGSTLQLIFISGCLRCALRRCSVIRQSFWEVHRSLCRLTSLFRHKPKVTNFSENGIYYHTNSITGAEQLLRKCGYLGWLIPPSLLHWATWKFFPDRAQRHCYLTSMPTAQGTIVQSDEWAAYRRVQNLPNVASHWMLNRSVTFVDPTTGVNTQNVESYSCRVKTKLKRMLGCHPHQISHGTVCVHFVFLHNRQ